MQGAEEFWGVGGTVVRCQPERSDGILLHLVKSYKIWNVGVYEKRKKTFFQKMYCLRGEFFEERADPYCEE